MTDVHDMQEGIRLLGYGESDTSGKWIKFELVDGEDGIDALIKYRGLKGELFDLAIAKSGEEKPKPAKKKKGPYGQFAKDLKLSNFFRTPEVWAAMGTDEQYRAWIQDQPSCISGKRDLVMKEYSNEFKCEAAHVRRSDESGMGYKADYACVPLTHEEHQDQHINGERVCLNIHIGHNKWADLKKYQGEFEAAKAWFDKQRIKYVSQWCWDTLKNDFQVESMSELSPNTYLWLFCIG